MNMHRFGLFAVAAAVISATVVLMPTSARADLTCTLPSGDGDENFPKGCLLSLVSGPVSFTGVTDGTDTHDIQLTSLTVTHNDEDGATVHFVGTDSLTGAFDLTGHVLPDENDNATSAGVPYNFTTLDLASTGGSDTLPSNWLFSLSAIFPSTGLFTSTDNGDGTTTVSSTFDLHLMLSLDSALSFTQQNNGETPTVLQADNDPNAPADTPDVPEPATIALFGAGLAGLGLLRKRARA